MENQNEIAIRIKVLVYYSKLHYALLNGHFIYVVILSLLCLHFPAFSILRFVFVRLFFLPHCFTDILHCEVCVLVCRRFLWMTYFGKTCGLCVCVYYIVQHGLVITAPFFETVQTASDVKTSTMKLCEYEIASLHILHVPNCCKSLWPFSLQAIPP